MHPSVAHCASFCRTTADGAINIGSTLLTIASTMVVSICDHQNLDSWRNGYFSTSAATRVASAAPKAPSEGSKKARETSSHCAPCKYALSASSEKP